MRKNNGRLAITAIVRDDAARARRGFRKLAQLRGSFDGLAMVVYENNSADGTKEVLRELARDIPDFAYRSEDVSEEAMATIATARHTSGALCRIEIIAHAREQAREAVVRDYGDYDYVLVVDIDSTWFSLGGIVRNVARLERGEFDGIAANGVTKWLRYRDAFAFRSPEYPFGPELLGDYWWENTVRRIQVRMGGTALMPVYSAFGGAALYSMAAFKAGKYGAIPDAAYMKVQDSLDLTRSSPEERRLAGSVPIPNTNYSEPIVCEHVPFCYSMRSAGFDRVAVDPAWRILFMD